MTAPDGIIASGQLAVLNQLQPGVTPAQTSARDLSLLIPARCGDFRPSCSFLDGNTAMECGWFGDGSTQRVLECRFDGPDGTPRSLTFLPNGQFTLQPAWVSASALLGSQGAVQNTFRAGVWSQSDAQMQERQPLWEQMVRSYTARKGAQMSRRAVEQQRATDQFTQDATAILTGIAAGLSQPASGGQSSGLRPGCDCPTGNVRDCSDELSGLQPIEAYCR